MGMTSALLQYLDSDTITDMLIKGEEDLSMIEDYIEILLTDLTDTTKTGADSPKSTKDTKDEPNTTPSINKELEATLAAAFNRREFRIHGQIGRPGQADKLCFQSLACQIEEGLAKGYPEPDIMSAVIRAVGHGLPLHERGKSNLSLPRLRSILRSHFNEKDALTSHQ